MIGVSQTVEHEDLKASLRADGVRSDSSSVSQHLAYYSIWWVESGNSSHYLDSSHIRTNLVGLLPTSRGTITLSSADPAAAPLIDPNYYSTEADRYRIREGVGTLAKFFGETATDQKMVVSETLSEGCTALTSRSSDADIDKLMVERAVYVQS